MMICYIHKQDLNTLEEQEEQNRDTAETEHCAQYARFELSNVVNNAFCHINYIKQIIVYMS